MGNESPHSVVHRRSLAHRMFVSSASARDIFLGNPKVTDFSPTVQKYYTGISLRRYIIMVCVEYPLILLSSLVTWMMIPSTLLLMVVDLFAGDIHGFVGFIMFIGFLAASAVAVAALFFLWALVRSWAASGPSFPVRMYKKRLYSHRDPDFDDFPEKFPGPVALLKKWILSTGSGESSKITWDSGKRRVGW